MTEHSREPVPDEQRKSRGRIRGGNALFPSPIGRDVLPADYTEVLGDIKERIQSERLRVTLAANAAMILLYWDIGTMIRKRQREEGWGGRR